MEWATSRIKYTPSENELYSPPRSGYSIKPYGRSLGRFVARRGRGHNGFVKNAIFYSVEDAKEWLDSLPAYPNPEPPIGREWTKNYNWYGRQYIPKTQQINLGE